MGAVQRNGASEKKKETATARPHEGGTSGASEKKKKKTATANPHEGGTSGASEKKK